VKEKRVQSEKVWDCLVLGAGSAGMTASIYLSRYKLDHLILGELTGGQFTEASVVENYPGFVSISGDDLVQAFRKHAESYGVTIRSERVGEIRKDGGLFLVKSASASHRAKTLILAMGAKHRALDVGGEKELLGKGVSYCATCDAPLFKGKEVAVVGGGDSAVTAAIHLSAFAKRVFIIHRRGEYRAQPHEVERMCSLPNVVEVLNNTIKEIRGKNFVEGVLLSNPIMKLPNHPVTLPVQGVFVEIGLIPSSALVVPLGVELDEHGHVKVDCTMQTNIPGVFAAGDLARLPGAIPLRQIVTSAADGARAAAAVFQCLREERPNPDRS